MKKRIHILLICLLTAGLSLHAADKSPQVEKNLSIFNDVLRQVDMWYVDTLNYEALTETAIHAMLKQIDPYTVYIPARKNDQVKMFTTGKYGGIGAVIMQYDSTQIVVSQPYAGLPAQKNDVRAGDVILEVDGKKCLGKKTPEVSELLRGKAGTTVKIKLRREGIDKPFVKEIVREEIKLPTVPHHAMLNDSVGYLDFSEFTEHSSRDFRRALEDLLSDDCRHLIIDLRGNGGGLISEALTIAGYFLPKGTEVVTTKGKLQTSSRSYKTISDPICPTLPLTILVDDHSASASEILCGSLQDLHRATLVGEKTFGKGLVQNIRKVVHDGNLKVTTAKYYLPSGRCIQGTGVTPDITVEEDSNKVNITYSLYRGHLYFDYATRYRQLHDSIAPLSTRLDGKPENTVFFTLDSLDLVDFEQFLQEKNFTYETETSRYFADLLRFAHQEDLDSATVASLEQLQTKLTTDYHAALWKHRDEVLEQLESEIASRYYFQVAPTIVALRRDPVLQRALQETNK
ncbi:MAG: S41 family peptidase [Paludibacteraceae bacterium]|nr:S41 family peptidase [Paludibacteraceae bacterium]